MELEEATQENSEKSLRMSRADQCKDQNRLGGSVSGLSVGQNLGWYRIMGLSITWPPLECCCVLLASLEFENWQAGNQTRQGMTQALVVCNSLVS